MRMDLRILVNRRNQPQTCCLELISCKSSGGTIDTRSLSVSECPFDTYIATVTRSKYSHKRRPK